MGSRLGTALVCILLSTGAARADDVESVLRVCADPDNLPLSNRSGEGYENKIAEALARDLGRRVEYTFFPQRMGFVRNTLRQRDETTKQFKCDVIIGVPKGYELTATTRPYMHSTYGLVFAQRAEFRELQTAEDLLKLPREKLSALRIGVFARSPGADWLLRNGLMERAVLYAQQSGDPAENPAHTIEQDLASKKIDLAIVWGPIAGFLVQRHSARSESEQAQWQAVPFLPDPQIKFTYEIAMGVRFGEKEWQGVLDTWIGEHQARIDEILTSYRIPLLDASGKIKQTRRENGP
ncbi:MAG TPA: quinoprotein dehydrogenase-associated putative ABC transporter substrate-binding protein [Steroidobacter sp.]|uniref:quinoprotein dehydrogenase-associated putative ABC transporter substrate-binding protein n=1 Tax=Steroidobacter sp. TaxID=1978227 RepID=UPI002ED7887F